MTGLVLNEAAMHRGLRTVCGNRRHDITTVGTGTAGKTSGKVQLGEGFRVIKWQWKVIWQRLKVPQGEDFRVIKWQSGRWSGKDFDQ